MNLGEEIFYQIRGRMVLKVMECGSPRDIVIEEGEMFLLPGSIPHSPQRFEDTMGLVIERERVNGELDGLRYYVDDSNAEVLWQRFFPVSDLGSQLKPLIQEFFSSEAFQSRVPEADMPETAWEADTTTLLPVPFRLDQRIAEIALSAKKLQEQQEAATLSTSAGGAATGGSLTMTPSAASGTLQLAPPLRLFANEFNAYLVGSETRCPMLPITTEVWVWVVAASEEEEEDGRPRGPLATVTEGDIDGQPQSPVALQRVGDTVLLRQGLEELTLSEGTKVLIVFTVGC